MAQAAFSCSCGTVSGYVADAPDTGVRVLCFCDSCRAGANYCNAGLAEGKPLDLFLTQPEHMKIAKGADQLAPFSFGTKNIVRWKAACCDAQMFSTQTSPKTAFMSVVTARFANEADTGPVRARTFIPRGDGKTGHEGKRVMVGFVLRALAARFSGRWRHNPLFDADTLQPIVPVTQLSKTKKAELLAASA